MKITRALISVTNKEGIVSFARGLEALGIEIIATKGTSSLLLANGISSTLVSDYINFPEILDGRVKTIHPKIFAGVLADRNDREHESELQNLRIEYIDLIVVNFYQFIDYLSDPNITIEDAIETIDIGGVAMARAAAKNYKHVAVVVDPNDYDDILFELNNNNNVLAYDTALRLAFKAFAYTAFYDANIAAFFKNVTDPFHDFYDYYTIPLSKVKDLRYGENPHQKSAYYEMPLFSDILKFSKINKHQGKELSHNNLLDIEIAVRLVNEFSEPACSVIKHNIPCGFARDKTLIGALVNARNSDPESAYGGIIGLNREVDADVANELLKNFIEVVIAPGYTVEALGILARKPNLIVLEYPEINPILESNAMELRSTLGGVLMQERDFSDNFENYRVVTKISPSDKDINALKLAWTVCKYVKSNAIVIANNDMIIGVGAGQPSRIRALKVAIDTAIKFGHKLKGAVLASDAFFPFADSIKLAAEAGIHAIVQPGGSIRDEEVIEAANEHKLTMIFTGQRHFRH